MLLDFMIMIMVTVTVRVTVTEYFLSYVFKQYQMK